MKTILTVALIGAAILATTSVDAVKLSDCGVYNLYDALKNGC